MICVYELALYYVFVPLKCSCSIPHCDWGCRGFPSKKTSLNPKEIKRFASPHVVCIAIRFWRFSVAEWTRTKAVELSLDEQTNCSGSTYGFFIVPIGDGVLAVYEYKPRLEFSEWPSLEVVVEESEKSNGTLKRNTIHITDKPMVVNTLLCCFILNAKRTLMLLYEFELYKLSI